jgi:uncharacterized membrane protein
MVTAIEIFFDNIRGFMAWNLFLAFIPFAFSIFLFNRRSHRNILWWLGLIIFIAFLPNAAYVITDIIHFVSDARNPDISGNGIIFVIIPQYLVFILAGFQCHVLSIIGLINYLRRKSVITNLVGLAGVELGMNLLCAYGVYLGRFIRLNSWYIVTKPDKVVDEVIDSFMQRNFGLAMFIFFVTITFLYYVLKWINLSISAWWQRGKMTKS